MYAAESGLVGLWMAGAGAGAGRGGGGDEGAPELCEMRVPSARGVFDVGVGRCGVGRTVVCGVANARGVVSRRSFGNVGCSGWRM